MFTFVLLQPIKWLLGLEEYLFTSSHECCWWRDHLTREIHRRLVNKLGMLLTIDTDHITTPLLCTSLLQTQLKLIFLKGKRIPQVKRLHPAWHPKHHHFIGELLRLHQLDHTLTWITWLQELKFTHTPLTKVKKMRQHIVCLYFLYFSFPFTSMCVSVSVHFVFPSELLSLYLYHHLFPTVIHLSWLTWDMTSLAHAKRERESYYYSKRE